MPVLNEDQHHICHVIILLFGGLDRAATSLEALSSVIVCYCLLAATALETSRISDGRVKKTLTATVNARHNNLNEK